MSHEVDDLKPSVALLRRISYMLVVHGLSRVEQSYSRAMSRLTAMGAVEVL